MKIKLLLLHAMAFLCLHSCQPPLRQPAPPTSYENWLKEHPTPPKPTLAEELTSDLEELDDSPSDPSTFKEGGTFVEATRVFTRIAEDLEKVKRSDSSAHLNKLPEQLRKKLAAKQQSYFPKLRKAYANAADKRLWEENIEVKIGGKNYSVLTFQGGHFAANRNIKEFQERLHDVFYALRFKQINYKWYRDADEFTYYEMQTPKDNEIVRQ